MIRPTSHGSDAETVLSLATFVVTANHQTTRLHAPMQFFKERPANEIAKYKKKYNRDPPTSIDYSVISSTDEKSLPIHLFENPRKTLARNRIILLVSGQDTALSKILPRVEVLHQTGSDVAFFPNRYQVLLRTGAAEAVYPNDLLDRWVYLAKKDVLTPSREAVVIGLSYGSWVVAAAMNTLAEAGDRDVFANGVVFDSPTDGMKAFRKVGSSLIPGLQPVLEPLVGSLRDRRDIMAAAQSWDKIMRQRGNVTPVMVVRSEHVSLETD